MAVGACKTVVLKSIRDDEFAVFQNMIYEQVGITMSEKKKSLVEGRLAKRLRHFGFSDYSEYVQLIKNKSNVAERQMVIDMLTTNETSFSREQRHFDFLTDEVLPNSLGCVR